MSYWPVELTLDAAILYLLTNSRNPYEIAFLVIAFIMHVRRQWEARTHIKEVSDRKAPFFHLMLITGAAVLVWATRTVTWPAPIWLAGIAGVVYFWLVKMFVKESGRCFTLFDPKIDIPQMIISGSMAGLAIKAQNPISVLWLSDFVYHILEVVYR